MRRKKLLSLYEQVPFQHHPWWRGVLNGEWSLAQVLRAETQHYLRTRAGKKLREEAMTKARNTKIFEMLLQTYLEECTPDQTGPSHLDLIKRLLLMGNVSEETIATATPTPGNIASIALYKDIAERGAACHLLGSGAVEHYYSLLAPKIYDAYVQHYHMSPSQAETYKIHGPMDKDHADRAFAVLDDSIDIHGWETIELSVRDAFIATSLHYDGMLQAATQKLTYWNGEAK